MHVKHDGLSFFFLLIYLIVITSCPNDQMRDLVELKVSSPVADTFIINSGAPTSSLSVTLNSSVSKEEDALEMRFKNAGYSWSDWETYSPEKSWNLSLGDGSKTVYAEYRDEGHHVVAMQNNIILNTGAPAGDFYIWGSAISGNRHLYVNSPAVTLCMTISNVESMRFSNDGGTTWSSWVPYSDTYSWNLVSGDGSKTVNAEFKTNAGTTTPSTRTITLDTTSPSANSFSIDNDAATANNIGVSLGYNYTDTNSVWAQYMNDGGSWSSQELLAGSPVNRSWTLRSLTGDRTVSLRLEDIAGNFSSVFTDTIYLSTAAPAVPSVTAATPTGDTTPTWSWNSVTGAVSYNCSIDGGSWTNTASTAYTPTSALSYGNHTLSVTAIDIAGNESSPGNFTVNIVQPPDTPAGLAIGTRTNSSLALSWNTALRADSYRLYRDTSAGGSFSTQVYSGTNTSFTDTGLSSGVTYYYKVRAENTGGNSSLSGAVSAPTIPATPSAPTTGTVTSTSIQVNWSAVSGATSYQLYISSSSGGTYTTQVYSGSSTTYTLTSLNQGRIYYFKVKATNSSGSSPQSGYVQSNTTLPSPLSFSVSKGTSTANVTVSWDYVSGANIYFIERRTLSGSFGALTSISGNTYQDTAATAGVTYYYRVRARSADNIYSSYTSEDGGYRAVAGGLPNLILNIFNPVRVSDTEIRSTYRITNIGNAHADLDGTNHSSVTDNVSLQNTYSGGGAGGGYLPDNLPILYPGEYYDYIRSAYTSSTTPPTFTSGEYIYATLTTGNFVESDETDNSASVQIP